MSLADGVDTPLPDWDYTCIKHVQQIVEAMTTDDVKERLVQATMRLLEGRGTPRGVTARQIAHEADANLAMINYYFDSKDALVNTAVDRLMADRALTLRRVGDERVPPRERLEEFLTTLSDLASDYAELTRPTIPYVLLEKRIELPDQILPMLRECCANTRSEAECRIIAYQLISFTQLVLYRPTDFLAYAGIDVTVRAERHGLIRTLLSLSLGDRPMESHS